MQILSFPKALRTFRKDDTGNVAIETVIIFPVLIFVLFLMMNFFDAYRAKSTTEKAAFAVSDMLSRETMAVDQDYIDGAHAIIKEFSTIRTDDHNLLVTHVAWSPVTNDYVLKWSHGDNNGSGVTTAQFNALKERLPELVDGESLIVVQTSSWYEPPLLKNYPGWMRNHFVREDEEGNKVYGAAHLVEAPTPLSRNIETFVFTRPRFAPQLAWAN